MLQATLLGKLHGRRVYRFPVRVQLNNSRMLRTDAEHVYLVHSFTAADAADYVRALYADRAETEITAYGPKGGRAAYRFIGWTSAIGHAMFARPAERQTRFAFDGETTTATLWR